MPQTTDTSAPRKWEPRRNWFQCPAEFFQLPFMEKLEEHSRGDDPQKILIRLFCFCVAGSPLESAVGKLRLDRETPYSEAILARRLHVDLNDLRVAMKVFVDMGLVREDQSGTLFVSWIGEHVKSRPATKSGIKSANWRASKKLTAGSVAVKPSRNQSETFEPSLEVKRVFPPTGENTQSREREIGPDVGELEPRSPDVTKELELIVNQVKHQKQEGLGRQENP